MGKRPNAAKCPLQALVFCGGHWKVYKLFTISQGHKPCARHCGARAGGAALHRACTGRGGGRTWDPATPEETGEEASLVLLSASSQSPALTKCRKRERACAAENQDISRRISLQEAFLNLTPNTWADDCLNHRGMMLEVTNTLISITLLPRMCDHNPFALPSNLCSNLIFRCFREQHFKINHFGTLSKSCLNSFMTTSLSEIFKTKGSWGQGKEEFPV
ncbi:uncharacterized protein [Gorilla gorilla gorilla]|uniref:uncharacterized protein n=1 Tax=Gorilla gorilla gorilla TaxID=9595 RepID=UPI003008B4CC